MSPTSTPHGPLRKCSKVPSQSSKSALCKSLFVRRCESMSQAMIFRPARSRLRRCALEQNSCVLPPVLLGLKARSHHLHPGVMASCSCRIAAWRRTAALVPQNTDEHCQLYSERNLRRPSPAAPFRWCATFQQLRERHGPRRQVPWR